MGTVHGDEAAPVQAVLAPVMYIGHTCRYALFLPYECPCRGLFSSISIHIQSLCLPQQLQVKNPETGDQYIVAESRLSEIPGAVPKPQKGKKKGPQPAGFLIIQRMKGTDLVGLNYAPLFPFFSHLKESGAFRVVADGYVTSDSGTGVVHQAPAFGEDDYRVCLANGVVQKGQPLPCPVDASGFFTEEASVFSGMYVTHACH